MRSKLIFALLTGAAASTYAQGFGQGFGQFQGQAPGQIPGQPALAHRIDLPGDAPVALVADEWGGSGATIRGSAYQLDVRVSLSLRNASQRRIRGITMTVTAQEAAPGGKGSISIPSLDVAAGETFPVRGDLHLLRPIGGGSGPLVEVSLDGLLFDDLTFYGPDKLHSRRSMLVWEMEARRDRQYLRAVLEQSGHDGLQKEMLSSLAREADRPQYGVQAVRGRAANSDGEQDLKFAFLHFPNAPVEPMDGVARIAGNEARAPKVVVLNRSPRVVKYLEIGWIVKDQQGREFLAATVPADMRMPSHSSSQILDDIALRFDPRTTVQSMTGFVSQVEFTDGGIWIPSHAELDDPMLRHLVAPSPEEQRLVQIYRKRGVGAVIDELKKFQDKPIPAVQ
ncbi:MAG TPA: hypothetical protein VGR73_06630 [Bryobacteraceae bacterium]|nr:hypothetical protein [Bryobacteraceae bacterium]